jgi:hypothetical protein
MFFGLQKVLLWYTLSTDDFHLQRSSMNLLTEPYLAQVARWPQTGRHILAQFDNTAVVVYQAYRPVPPSVTLQPPMAILVASST